MTVSLSLGVAFAVWLGLMKYLRKITWPALLVAFTAGVLLAGSTAGILAERAAKSGAEMVQTGATAVSDAAEEATNPTPATKTARKAKP